MMTENTKELLRDYTRNRSEDAFRALVREHSPVVYGTALRRLGGDRAAAQDVTQEVFTLLARKAHQLESVVLGGWLYRQAYRRAADHVRAEVRRKKRESIAMENQASAPTPDDSLAKELDEALLALAEKDRDALILRFFEDKEFKALGRALGLSEEAARKRVARALDRLTQHLKRRGVPVGSVSLGTAMQAYGSTPVPAMVISQVSGNALRAGTAFNFASLLIPVAAGVAATSLVAGFVHPRFTQDPPPSAFSRNAMESRARPTSTPASPSTSLEQLITEIRRAKSKPANTLTAIQLRQLYERIDEATLPDFIRLANDILSATERAAIYPRLLERSLAANPVATMDLILSCNLGKQTDAHGGSNLLDTLFSRWAEKDQPGCESWLIRNWENPVMLGSSFGGSLRNSLMVEMVDYRFSRHGVASVLELVQQIPATEDKAAALRGIAGMNPWHSSWASGDRRKWLDFHQVLKEFPDPRLSSELRQSFWKTLSSQHPDDVVEMRASMEPLDRFQVALGWMAATSVRGETTPLLSGESVNFTPVTDRDMREKAALEAGLAAGMPKARVLGEISRAMATCVDDPGFLEWFDAQEDVSEMDDTLATKVRQLANNSGRLHGREMIAAEMAMRISNPELRLKLSRGAFRLGLSRTPDAALAYAKGAALPSDLAAAFQSILQETP